MCKTRELFQSADEFNDYLVLREDLIYKLVNPASQDEVSEVWRYIEKYKAQNAEQIAREAIARPKRKVQTILGIIEEEGDFCFRVNADWAERAQMDSIDTFEPTAAITAPSRPRHPFRERYRDLIDSVCAGSQGLKDGPGATGTAGSTGSWVGNSLSKGIAAPMSPAFVQPLLPPACDTGFGSNPTSPINDARDPALHASGGGQVAGLGLKKARYFFFSNLAAVAAAAATTASAA